METENLNWLSKNMRYIIASWVLLIWGLITIYIIARFLNFIEADKKSDMTALLALYSGISTIACTIINFFFSSTKGSEDKSKTIAEMVTNKPLENKQI